jgi:prepilin-type N-terminal cleavage/methylation domain-containing protein
MTGASKSRRQGFTLVELLIVMVMIGILAGLALPSLQSAVWKARSAEVVSDIHTITLAYHEFLADGGGRVNNAAWGRVPPDLVPYLPDGFSFTDPFVDYRWTRVAPNASPWDLEMGMIRVRPVAKYKDAMMRKLASMAPSTTSVVTNNQVRFYIVR